MLLSYSLSSYYLFFLLVNLIFIFSFWAVQVFECFEVFSTKVCDSLWNKKHSGLRNHVIIKLHLNYSIFHYNIWHCTIDYLPSKPITFSEYLYCVYWSSPGKKLKEIQLSTDKYPFDVATKNKTKLSVIDFLLSFRELLIFLWSPFRACFFMLWGKHIEWPSNKYKFSFGNAAESHLNDNYNEIANSIKLEWTTLKLSVVIKWLNGCDSYFSGNNRDPRSHQRLFSIFFSRPFI